MNSNNIIIKNNTNKSKINNEKQSKSIKSMKSVNLIKPTSSKQSNEINDSKGISVTDEKMINEVLENIGKKTKNSGKKAFVNNFIENKNNYDSKKQTKQIIDDEQYEHYEQDNKKKTYTENLTKEEISQKLEDYKVVDDISKIPLDTHLRYFIKKDNEMLFRMGGNLKRNLDLPTFVVLRNALGKEWTVQVKDTIFYKKMTIKEIKEEYDNIILDLHDKIKKLKQKIKELEKMKEL
jgi:hypothetical protein